MILWLLLVTSVFLALIVNHWWWLAVVPIAIWNAFRWHFYKGRPWKRIHFPMMRNYAAALGFESAEAERDSREIDYTRALNRLVQITLPGIGEEGAKAFVINERLRCASFADKAVLLSFLEHKYADKPSELVDQFVAEAKEKFDPSSPWLMARMVVAGVIELKFGPMQRGEYLYAVLTGKAT